MATCTLPEAITDAILTAHSVSEPSTGEVAWTSGATFALGARAIVGAPTSTVTITQAAPGVVTWTSHGLPNGAPVVLTTTGTLPAGLTAGKTLYIVNRATNTFQLSEAVDGQPITTTTAGSGTHTALASIHRVYESLIASNTGNAPANDDGTKWFDRGPTNLWSMIDLYRPSVTWGASPMTFQLTPGQRIRSIFLGNITADSVRIVMKVGGVTKYDVTVSLWSRTTFTPTDFCFKAWSHRSDIQKIDLPVYSNPVIEVTLTRAVGLVGLGEMVIGNPEYLGKTQYGAESKARNYTKFDRRADGTPTAPVKQRNVLSSPMTIWFDKEATANLMDLRERLNGVVAVFSGLDDDEHPYFPAVLILGMPTTMDLNLAHLNHGVMTLTPEEY